jgi:hypothetical protein
VGGGEEVLASGSYAREEDLAGVAVLVGDVSGGAESGGGADLGACWRLFEG